MNRALSVIVLLIGLCLLFVPKTTAMAAQNRIHSIDVQVVLQEDGSALFHQIWDVTSESGTEYFITQSNIQDMEYLDFTVRDKTRTFQSLNDWDINRTREEKANKSGINRTDDGLELCWGIGEYGRNTFFLSYRVTNFVKSYTDYDGFISRFVNDELSSSTERASVTISVEGKEMNKEQVKGWAFGFDGTVDIDADGNVVVIPRQGLTTKEHMTLMLRFDKGWMKPVSTVNHSFDQIQQKALEGSDFSVEKEGQPVYKPISTSKWIIPLIFVGLVGSTIFPPVIFILVILFMRRSLRERSMTKGKLELVGPMPQERDVDYVREVPFDGQIPAVFAGYNIKKPISFNDLFTAYLLRWIQKGVIELSETQVPEFLGLKEKTVSSIKLLDRSKLEFPNEKLLYECLQEASNHKRTLNENEFKKWSKKNYRELSKWHDEENKIGRDLFVERGAATLVQKSKWFGLVKSEVGQLNEKGIDQFKEILGFKKFLDDFTLIGERASMEVELWDEYLIYAAIFGLAERVF